MSDTDILSLHSAWAPNATDVLLNRPVQNFALADIWFERLYALSLDLQEVFKS